MEDRRSIAKKAAIGVALVIAAAGAVLFYLPYDTTSF